MKLVYFTPYGTLQQESGLVYLLANYLQGAHPESFQLRCNGIFPVCVRDREYNWKRTSTSCLECVAEQNALAKWSTVEAQDLSQFLNTESLNEGKRWVLRYNPENHDAPYLGSIPYELVLETFRARVGAVRPNLKDPEHLTVLRELLKTAVYSSSASRTF